MLGWRRAKEYVQDVNKADVKMFQARSMCRITPLSVTCGISSVKIQLAIFVEYFEILMMMVIIQSS